MRTAILPVSFAVLIFIAGVAILNVQLWYSARLISSNAAMHTIKNIDTILDEARVATQTAMKIVYQGCSAENQYQLGTEAALKPHLRTIIILKEGKAWCSSLPGNRVLLYHLATLPDEKLLLLSAKETTNDLPVLIYQTPTPEGKIVVSISDAHIRDALNSIIPDAHFALLIDGKTLGTSGDVSVGQFNEKTTGVLNSPQYPFSISYRQPSFFSPLRVIQQGSGLLFFIFILSCTVAYTLYKYTNKYTTPEENLRRAIENGEIIPFYQPIVNGRTGEIHGVEVLARWKHERTGYISPTTFIPVAEKTGLIIPLTKALMAQVVQEMNKVASKLPEGFHIGINFSASHVSAPSFMTDCLQYRESFQHSHLILVLELTEHEPLHIDQRLIDNLNTLRRHGFFIALDDFGTGYSGLSYLHDLKIDFIKIDQSFVSRVDSHEDSTMLLDCVLDMVNKLSLQIVAEGVETTEQLEYLNRKNIALMQGYYFYKPLTYIELVMALLAQNNKEISVD